MTSHKHDQQTPTDQTTTVRTAVVRTEDSPVCIPPADATENGHSGKPVLAEQGVSAAAFEHLAAVLVDALELKDEDGWESVSDDPIKAPSAETLAIRALNDTFRRTFQGGTLMLTAGIVDLGLAAQRAILMKVATFDAFSGDNDPYGEHDFGAINHASDKIFWKIDYYDPTLTYGSDNPADPALTTRVLTVMLAAEY